jgi:hypothetical protein
VTRRQVRVDAQFFAEVDAQLGEIRRPNGEVLPGDRRPLAYGTLGVGCLMPDEAITLFGVEIYLTGPE